MTQQLLDLYNSRLEAYNAALDAKIARAAPACVRAAYEAKKLQPVAAGELTDDQLRERICMQRRHLGIVLKDRAVELLRQVVPGVLRHGRFSVGLSYGEILAVLRVEFPEAQVTPACLRWYVSHINGDANDLGEQDTGLPQYRPRSRYKPLPAHTKDQESPVPGHVFQPLQSLERY
jgi:hypothetical protein